MHTYIHTHKYIHVCMQVSNDFQFLQGMQTMQNIHKYIHAYIHTYIHTYVHNVFMSVCRSETFFSFYRAYQECKIYTNTYIHACIHTYICMYVLTQMYSCLYAGQKLFQFLQTDILLVCAQASR
jgi:hypothetical protein